MKKLMLLLAVLSFAVSSWAQSQTIKAEKPIKAMAWLLGGVWIADASQMGPSMKIETRYTMADNDAYVRFTTHFVSDKGTAKRYDGNFYWDADANKLMMWYMSAENTIFAGPITVNGDVTTFDFRGEDFEGKMGDLRVNLTKKSSDLYRWQLMEKSGEQWKNLAELDYARKAGS